MTFESNIAYVLRFMIDKKVCSRISTRLCLFSQIVGMNWLEVKKGQYSLRHDKDKLSNCQIELDCSYTALDSHAAEGEWGKIAPLRILSFDLECAGRKGIFPEAEIDPVIQIANMVTRQGEHL